MNLTRAFVTVSGLTAVSRVFGFIRDMLFAYVLGSGFVADAFYVALKLPNFFRRLFAEGAFNAAFVPLFAGKLETDGNEEAKRLAREVLAILALTLAVLTVLAELFMPSVISVLAPGFVNQPDKFDLTVLLTRITFPYLLLISLVSLFGAMLNSAGSFAAYAAAPIVLNLSLIGAAAVSLMNSDAQTGALLAWGVTFGGIAQLVLVAFVLRRLGLMPWLAFPRMTAGVKRFLSLFAPAALGAGVVQINLVIDIWAASFLPTGAISYLYYADRVNQLPLGVIGIAVGTALLPLLSRQLKAGDHAGANDSQSRAVELIMIFCLPAAAAFAVIAEPIIVVLFERGAFTAADSAASAAALAAFGLGLPAYVLLKVLAPGFFAREDTRTPVKAAVVGVLSNIAIMLVLIWSLEHVGIALATAGSAWINCAILYIILRRRKHFEPDRRLRKRVPRLVAATAIMTLALLAVISIDTPLQGHGRYIDLVILIGSGTLVYGIAGHVMHGFRYNELRELIRRNDPPASQTS